MYKIHSEQNDTNISLIAFLVKSILISAPLSVISPMTANICIYAKKMVTSESQTDSEVESHSQVVAEF